MIEAFMPDERWFMPDMVSALSASFDLFFFQIVSAAESLLNDDLSTVTLMSTITIYPLRGHEFLGISNIKLTL